MIIRLIVSNFFINFFTGVDDDILTGGKVCIDICELGYDLIMPNPTRDACYNPCCNGDPRLWFPHLPCTKEEIYTCKYFKDVLPSPVVSSFCKNNAFLYTPQIESYFKQPHIPKSQSIKQQTICPPYMLNNFLDDFIDNFKCEIYF